MLYFWLERLCYSIFNAQTTLTVTEMMTSVAVVLTANVGLSGRQGVKPTRAGVPMSLILDILVPNRRNETHNSPALSCNIRTRPMYGVNDQREEL